jgi:multidrug transporter EmrE-like cation transporter
MTSIILIIAITLNAVANILLKVGAERTKESNNIFELLLGMATNPITILAIFCFAAGMAAYNYVLMKTNLSVAYPIMTSVGYIIVLLASWMFLKETLTILQISGILLIIAGVWMVTVN